MCYAPHLVCRIGWNLHHEAFMMDNNLLNVARLKLSYGTSGSQAFNSYQANDKQRRSELSGLKGAHLWPWEMTIRMAENQTTERGG